MDKKTLVFTATYNEAGNIEDLLSKINENLPQADILVIDDNSPDGTGTILDKIAAENNFLKVIHREGKLGVGSAHKRAFKYAIENEYYQLFTMDADFSHDPKDLPRLMKKLENNDFVIGSRWIEGGQIDYGLIRKIFSRTANFLARNVLGINLTENTNSLRGFKISLLKRFPLKQVKSDGYSFFFETTFTVSRMTKNLGEIPSHFADRREGVSKINKFEILKGVLTLFKLFFRRFLPLKIPSQT